MNDITGNDICRYMSGMKDEEYKVVVLVRQDLKMSKGKTAAQACHAAVGCALASKKKDADSFRGWDCGGGKIAVLKVQSEKDLFMYKSEAEAQDIVTSLVCDAGRTEVDPGTNTCLGIGPHKQSSLDRLTGDLSML